MATILATSVDGTRTAELRRPGLRRAAIATAAAALVLFAAAPSSVLDPIAGFDDYPTLFGWLAAYFGKTLSEGRWVNFLWQVHVGPIDRHAAFLFVTLAWCAVAGLIAAAVFRDDHGPWRAALFAVAMAVAPPFSEVIAWSNTLVPVLAVLLAYVMIAATAPPWIAAAAILAFAPLGLMTYTTSPMIMALALALCGDWRGGRRGVSLAALLGVGVALGLLVIYYANWKVHGVFGVVADQWREPTPVENAGDLTRNVGAAAERFRENVFGIVHPAVWVGLAIFLAAPFAAYAAAPRRALPVMLALGAGIGLLIVNYLTSGVSIAVRAWPFAWFAVAALYALSAREVANRYVSGAFLGVLLIMALIGTWYWNMFHAKMAPFQRETAALAEAAEAAAPGAAPIAVFGPAHLERSLQPIHNIDWARLWSLSFRLHVLTGREACICGMKLGRSDLGYCLDEATEAMCRAAAPDAARLTPERGAPAVGAGPDGMAIIRYAE